MLKVNDLIHIKNPNHKWENIACKILAINKDKALIGNKPNGETEWINLKQIEPLSDFVAGYMLNQIKNNPEAVGKWSIR